MKDAYYFSHDSNARNDPKIQALMSKYGFEGYGWYWAILEILREQPDYKYPYGRYTAKIFARLFGCDEEKTTEFVDDCCNEFVASGTSLLHVDDACLWSDSLIRRMMLIDEKRDKARNSINTRWANNERTTDEVQTNSERTTRKGKERKVNTNPIIPIQGDPHQKNDGGEDFVLFWQHYPKKVDKGAALKAWNSRMKAGALPDTIISGAKRYAKHVAREDPKYTKNPATFLNSLAYENEYETPNEEKNHGYENWSGTGRDRDAAD